MKYGWGVRWGWGHWWTLILDGESFVLTKEICILAKGHALDTTHYYQAFAFSQARHYTNTASLNHLAHHGHSPTATTIFHCRFLTITTYDHGFKLCVLLLLFTHYVFFFISIAYVLKIEV